MRVIIFFDLPMVTASERKAYTKFRKFLINEGFVMMQESVYSRLLLNGSAVALLRERIRNNRPDDGLVQMLTITEKQYSSIEYIVGNHEKYILQNEERLVII